MEEKMNVTSLKEIASILKDIREKLTAYSWGSIRGPTADPAPSWGTLRGPIADPAPQWGAFKGPVADPAPSWGYMRPEIAASLATLKGPVADPIPFWISDKAKLAKLKVRQLDMQIAEYEKQIEYLKLERELLAEEYKI